MSNDHSHTAYRRPHRSLKSKYKLSEAPISIQNETKSELVVTRKSTAKHFLVWAVILLMLLLLSSQQHEYNVRNVSDGDVIVKKVPEESENDANGESCLRPRRNSNAAVKSPLKPPFINLGMPKMGSSSLHNYFKCGGYKSVHWRCGERYCSECIREAVQAGLPPFSKCNITDIDSYAQIDRGPENLVQVNYLNEIVRGVPNATFILTFRNMTNWYMSMNNWQSIHSSEINMRQRFEEANITGLPKGVGRNVSEFRYFYCEYVKRVREEVAKYPGRHELIEIDIEDPTVGWQMEEVFGTNHACWDKKNAAKHNGTVSVNELQRRY